MNKLERLCMNSDNLKHIDSFNIIHFAKSFRKLMFYSYFYEDNDFNNYYELVTSLLRKIINNDVNYNILINKLVDIRESLELDVIAMLNGDPAASSKQEIVLCYPGVECITYYRIAHEIYNLGYKLEARIISEYAHRKTQIDIHPEAIIGKNFCIDHGTGIVIGATTIIGDNVRIYQGVTLGAKWLNDISRVSGKRHPTILDNTIIYANATILGGNTIIKEGSVIGANAFITNSN